VAFLIAAALLLILPTGFIGPVFVLGGGALAALFAVHYLVWGRLIDMELQDPDSTSENIPKNMRIDKPDMSRPPDSPGT
jgi:hypothetical protein